MGCRDQGAVGDRAQATGGGPGSDPGDWGSRGSGCLGVSREWLPERLIPLDAMPRSAGEKVAKAELRKLI